jgi:hypothetical protein
LRPGYTKTFLPETCVLFLLGCLLTLAGCGGGTGATPNIVPPPSCLAAPSAPSGLTASNTTGTGTTLTWTAPATVPTGCTVTSYSVYENNGTTAIATTTNTTDTVNGLLPSTTYTFTVAASDSFGTSAQSSSVNVTTGALAADFFVAPPPTGSDGHSGTVSAPFATIARAQTAVRAILSNPQGRTNPVIVMIEDGTYFQTQPLSFTTADSGKSTLGVIWQNYPGEAPVISGGMQISLKQNGTQWQATLPSTTQYFEQLFYNGQRRLRPRVGSPPLVGTYYQVAAPVFVGSPETNCPNLPGQSSGPYQCFDRFKYTAGDPISASWANLSPPPGNPCNAPAGPFPAGDIALYSFEQMGTSKMLISCIDTTNQIIYLTGSIRQPLDFTDTTTGFVAGHRYLVENVKDEFTQPGQWFLDRSNATWKLNYIAQSNENPSTDTIIIPQATQVMIATGLQYVTFQGLTFAHDNFTVPAAGYPYMRMDQTITSAVSCLNCQNVTFDGVTITQTAGTGLDFTTTDRNSATANNTFQNGAVFDIAANGIRIGLLAQYFDTPGNLPQKTLIQNTVISGYGRVFAKGFGIAQGCNHDNLYTHNDIYDGYSGGINIGALNCPVANTSYTSNNIASFNNIYNLGQGVSNDFGCVYFNTAPQGAVPPPGNQALNNVCHDVTDSSIFPAVGGYGGQGMYIDNNSGDVNVENNLVYRVSGSTVAQTCGPQGVTQDSHNTIKNNILAFSIQSMKQQGCTPSSATNKLFDMTNNLIIFDKGNIQGGCYSCLGGDCASVLPATVHFESNMYCFTPSGNSCTLPTNRAAFYSSNDPPNQAANCARTTPYSDLTAWQGVSEDTSSVLQNPFSSSSSNNDYSLSGSPGVGFVVFDPTQAGTTGNTIPVLTVPPTFPTQSYAPSDF